MLAGGGLAGIAWETGIVRGIADESPATAQALLNSDVLVGTSAGSAVAAQLSSGVDLETLFERQIAEASAEIDPGINIDDITELFLTAVMTPNATTAEKLQRIGAVALSTKTVAESVRREVIAQRLPSHEWPDRELRISAIDTATGELVTFNRAHGVGLVDAVAASCAVPGAWPPVTIGGRRYMDGGVGSSVNLKLAADCDIAVVLVPAGKLRRHRSAAEPPMRLRRAGIRRSGCSLTTTRWPRSAPTRSIRRVDHRPRWRVGNRGGASRAKSPISWAADSRFPVRPWCRSVAAVEDVEVEALGRCDVHMLIEVAVAHVHRPARPIEADIGGRGHQVAHRRGASPREHGLQGEQSLVAGLGHLVERWSVRTVGGDIPAHEIHRSSCGQ